MAITQITLLGAGGKMGCRITDNLKKNPDYAVDYVEIGASGLRNLAERGITPTPQEDALGRADVVILALPDKVIGAVTHALIPSLKPGTMVMGLDPAAAYAEVMPIREDLTYFVTHPCHPPLFGPDGPQGSAPDWFGGVSQAQSVVCTLHRGPEADYAKGERIAATIFAPILRVHRITVEQMAILEPAVVESTMICCVMVMKRAMEQAVSMGVPREAAWDFCMGHIRVELAIVFGFAGFPFSDGAQKAVDQNMSRIIRDDWMKVIEIPAIKRSVAEITGAH